MKRRLLLAAFAAAIALPVGAQTITLNGASSSTTTMPSRRRMVKFEELVKKYYGKPINFVLHKNSELGLEKQYFEYMAQGKAVDYAIVSPAHMSTFSKAAPFIDAPFLFRDLDHWNKVLDADVLKPVADEINSEGRSDADRLRRRRYPQHLRQQAGEEHGRDEGSESTRAGRADLVQDVLGSGMAPTVIAYNEVYNAIQNGVIAAGENEAAGVEADEVLRSRPQPQHDAACDHDPPDCAFRPRRSTSCRPICRRRSSRRARRPAPTAVRSSRARTPRSSTRWKRPASSSASRLPTAPR